MYRLSPAGRRATLRAMETQAAPAGALAGLKVVELGQLIAGPFAAKTLADFGAEVIFLLIVSKLSSQQASLSPLTAQ